MLARRSPTAAWRAKAYLLTWAQCPIRKERVLEQLKSRFGELMQYACCCNERHEDGNLHSHAFVLFAITRRVTQHDFDMTEGESTYHANVEVSRTYPGAIAYVKKGPDWIEHGTNPIVTKKKDRAEKVKFVHEHTIDEIIASGTFTLFEINAAKKLKDMQLQTQRSWPAYKKRNVYWFYGDTGTGKTRKAVQMCERENWVRLSGNMRDFMNGYEDQTHVILDDIRCGLINFETLLSITDGYRTYVNVKGSFREWVATTIIITAPKRPEEVFYDHQREQPWDKIDQLLRRIDVLRDFNERPWSEEDAEEALLALPPEEWSTIPRPPSPVPEEAPQSPPQTVMELPSYALPTVQVPFVPLLDRWYQEDGPAKPVAVLPMRSN